MCVKVFLAFFRRTAIALSLGTIIVGCPAYAEDIKLIGSPGVKGVVSALGKPFESDTGHKVVMDFAVFADLKRRIDAGESFDIAILSPVLIDGYIKQGRILSDSRTDFGRGGLGVGIRKGAPKPDISSIEALKRTFLNSKLIAYAETGESGVHFLAMLDKLGIAQAMKPRIRGYRTGMTESVANGEAEFVVTSVTVIIPAAGIELVGEVPRDVQSYVFFTAGISASSKDKGAARALLRFMTSPAALPAFRANGMEPG